MRVLVTGASGFVGRALVASLAQAGHTVVAAVRDAKAAMSDVSITEQHADLLQLTPMRRVVVGNIDAHTDWREALQGIDVVVHTAARVHVMQDRAIDAVSEYRMVNVDGTRHLAQQAIAANCKRFIFLSSIKVNGEYTTARAFTAAADVPQPQDPYALSKYEAERALFTLSKNTSLELVIIRPPLIYGAGVKANFLTMLQLIKKGFPLPLAGVCNSRSLLALCNLVDFIELCLRHPSASGHIFLVADGEDVSSAELARKIARALNKSACIFPCPLFVLQLIAVVLGKKELLDKLTQSLQIDIGKNKQLLGWVPKYSMDQALEQMLHPKAQMERVK